MNLSRKRMTGYYQVINLTLHGVGKPSRPLEPEEANVWLSRDSLEAILDELRRFNHFTLTVDDGNESDIEIVMPALLRKEMKAIFFIPAGKLGQQGYLGRKDVQSLVQEGMEVGTHGMFHRDWRRLNDHELGIEINDSKKILEDITGQAVPKAACPFGSYDRRVLRHLRAAKFQRVYTSDGGRAQSNRWLQPRNSLHASDNPDTLRLIMAQPNSMSERLILSVKRLVKRWR